MAKAKLFQNKVRIEGQGHRIEGVDMIRKVCP